MIKDGTYIRNEETGEYLVKSDVKLEEFAVDLSGTEIIITTSEKNDVFTANTDDNVPGVFALKGITDDVSTVEIQPGYDKNVSNVKLNRKNVQYNFSDGILKNIGN